MSSSYIPVSHWMSSSFMHYQLINQEYYVNFLFFFFEQRTRMFTVEYFPEYTLIPVPRFNIRQQNSSKFITVFDVTAHFTLN
jgi:hypothetical protein